MLDSSKLYRWCDDYGGGLLLADSVEDAMAKLNKKYGDSERTKFLVWLWKNDDYYDEENPDVFDIYG